MAVNQPPQAGGMTTSRIPSYMRPTKTSTRKAEIRDAGRGSVLKQKDGNQALSVPLRSTTKVKETGLKGTMIKGKRDGVLAKGKEKRSTGPGTVLSRKSAPEQAQTKTLGKLFTDGGLEEILIKVLEMMKPKEMAKCLFVCKNTNEVMVKTSSIQLRLRQHLYGIKSSSDSNGCAPKDQTSVQMIDRITLLHRQHTLFTVKRVGASSLAAQHIRAKKVQGNMALFTLAGNFFCVMEVAKELRIFGSLSSRTLGHEIDLCMQDRVVVEHEIVNAHHPHPLTAATFRVKFHEIRNSIGPDLLPSKHPRAQFHELSMNLPRTHGRSHKFRLHPGGLAAVLFEDHHCRGGCDRSTSDEHSIRLAIFDWHAGGGLGVIKVPRKTVRIFDFDFLNEKQVVCCSLRVSSRNGRPFPSLDIYEIPQIRPILATVINPLALPTMRLGASFRFPALRHNHGGCIWTSSTHTHDSRVSDFKVNVSQSMESSALLNRLLTFQLSGQVDNTEQLFQGVILIPRLQEIVLAESEARSGVDEGPLQVEWDGWNSAVSLQKSSSFTSLPESRGSIVTSLSRCEINSSHAVLFMRDYNQQLLHAPSDHMTQMLGQIHTRESEHNISSPRLFAPVDVLGETRTICSPLFKRRFISFGLGYRKRKVDLGEYVPNNIAASKIGWGKGTICIYSNDSGLRVYNYSLGL